MEPRPSTLYCSGRSRLLPPSRPAPNMSDSARVGKEMTTQNPVWQTLALRPLSLQRKLAISQPNDPYEQEADRVAERVMRMPAPSGCGQNSFTPAPRAAQRKCAGCEDEEEIKLHRKGEIGGQVNDAAVAPRIVNDALSSPGRPLSPATRAFMEPRFGRDFSQVRVHAGSEAARSARSVNALAYTVGHDIVFGNDRLEDETAAGRTLLAHELAHVVQQSQGLNESTVQRWTIDDCNTAQSEYITGAIARGFADLTTALRLVSVRPVTDAMRDSLWLAFRDSSDRTAELVTNNIRHLKDHLTSSRYRCTPNTNPDCGVRSPATPDATVNSAYVSTGGPQTPFVYICTPTFTDLDDQAQAQTIIHEAAHQYLGLADTGYFSTGSCLETRRTQPDPGRKDSGTAGDNPIYRLNNADSYSCFVHFLVHMAQPARTSAAAGYRGDNLRLDSISTTIYTQATNPQEPLFRVTGAPSNSGFQYRWKLLVGEREFNLESTRGYNTGEFHEDGLETPVFVSRGVRSILGRDHIRSGVIQCEIQVFSSAGDRFPAPIIRKSVEISVIEGEDPLDRPLF
jgi:hypothetical protein